MTFRRKFSGSKELLHNKKFLFLVISVVILTVYLLPFRSIENLLLKEPWEESLDPNFETCKEIVPLLLEKYPDEGAKSSRIFSWKTPKFADLILKDKRLIVKGDEKEAMIDALCNQFSGNSTRVSSNIDLTAVSYQHPSLTSIDSTKFTVILNKKPFVVGQNITLSIITKDKNGGLTANGSGDYFKIRAENPETRSSVAASSIENQGNGTYIAQITTFWSGRHDIKVFFGQSGHFVDLIKRFTSKYHAIESRFYGEYRLNHRNNFLNGNSYSKHNTSRTVCHINPLFLNTRNGLCNYSMTSGEEWFCVKPKLFTSCADLYAVYSKRRTNSMKLFQLFPTHDRGTLERKTLQGFPSNVDVGISSETVAKGKLLPNCGPNLVTPHPSGYWYHGVWKSRVCNNFHYSFHPLKKAECLQNKTLYFIGDSTARQWFEYFIDPPDSGIFDNVKFTKHPFKADEKTTYSDVWEPRMAVIEDYNVTVFYRSHGQPLQNGGLFSATTFVSVQLDEIPPLPDKGSHLTIMLALGPHFFLYNPDVYLNRIEATKRAALRLLSRNPKATVIFKGTNTFIRGIDIGECCLSDWISYRQHKIAKHVFDGTPIVYLDVWDMTVSHDSEDLVHPVSEVITNEIDMALSFMCLRSK